ncbi:MAG: hypothetical protein ACXVED_04135, partial [Bacteroidia bacterium]
MKNLKISLIVLFVSLVVNTISAQQKAYINQSTVKTNNNTNVFMKFDVDQLTSAAQVEALRAKLASFSGVTKVVATPVAGNKSTFTMTFTYKNFKGIIFQNALISAGLNDVVVNGKDN